MSIPETEISPPALPDGRRARSARTRAKLLAAGHALVVENGLWHATVGDVVDKAGVSRRAFFDHFQTVADFRADLVSVYARELSHFLVLRYNLPVPYVHSQDGARLMAALLGIGR